jgi:cell wall-associated NlpC family hydrolase
MGSGKRGSGAFGGAASLGGGGGGGGPYVAVSGQAGEAIRAAQSQLGVPYRFASSVPGVAFDCSGLTAYAWATAGVSLPHQSRNQYSSLPHVPASEAQPGDLIFYYSPISHVGIYLGGGMMIHSPQSGSTVSYAQVNWDKVVGVGRPG